MYVCMYVYMYMYVCTYVCNCNYYIYTTFKASLLDPAAVTKCKRPKVLHNKYFIKIPELTQTLL